MENNVVDLHAVKLGDHITVLKWTSHHDFSYVGDILQVEEIDHPFIVVNRKNKYNKHKDMIKLDLRRLEIKKLSESYVVAYLDPDNK